MVTPAAHGSQSGEGASAAPLAALSPAGALDPRIQPQCSLAVQLRRVTGSVVGRSLELTAIQQEVGEARTRMAAVTTEGEPGIGKTRLLVAAAELATSAGFTAIAVTADEEIRGPFLLAQSIFAAPALREAVVGTPGEAAVQRVIEAISGHDEPGLEALSPDAKLLRAYDLGAMAIATVAAARPLALLIDDAQWADDDTLRMLRYIVRSDSDRPVFLFLTLRPEEFAKVQEAVNFVADMERMGLVRRLRPGRFNQLETAELVKQILGGSVEPASVEAMHGQSEGVPFIVEELARTYRETGMIQQLDGVWTLGRNAARLVPSAVRTLIQRRAAQLPADTRSVLSDAAVLGRSFSLRDLAAVRTRLDGDGQAAGALADSLDPAVQAGLLHQHSQGEPADYTFTHEQVREFAIGELPQARRRAVHRTVADLLSEAGDPTPAALPLLVQHALAGGDADRAARLSIDAARAALRSNAPEEALRLVDQALPIVTGSQDRKLLLTTRDDAYAILRRPVERLEGLAELTALAEALRDPELEVDVQLRRAAAFRLAHDEDAAADLARRVRDQAAGRADRAAELRADLELGQALLRSPLGESFGAALSEVDLDGAEDAYRRAITLAEELGDQPRLAAALRETGTILLARVRAWFAGEVLAGRGFELGQRVVAGESIQEMLASFPIYPVAAEAQKMLERALGIYEQLGDRSGVMSTVIAMAYINYAPVIHIASSARHLEEIRRVAGRLTSLVTESERARQEMQMLYGVQVFARAKVVPDLMISRGEEAHRAARMLGDRSVEFLAAGTLALSHVDLGEVAEAEKWLDRAASAASSIVTPARARQLELWRGMVRAAAGDAAGMRQHLEMAVKMATDQGRPAARCEALAELALAAARFGAESGDEGLLDLAERSAADAKALCAVLTGNPPWTARADAARATVALARGDTEAAVVAASEAMEAMEAALHEDLDLDIVLAASRVILTAGPPEAQETVRSLLRMWLSRIAQGTVDEGMRVRWLRGPVGRAMAELAGPIGDAVPSARRAEAGPAAEAATTPVFDEVDQRLLQLLTEGNTNQEMAEALGLPEEAVAQRLAALLARLGASTRAEATSLAFRGMAA